jgi:hypothetical protein
MITGIWAEIEPAPCARPLSEENRMSSPAGVVWSPRLAGPIRASLPRSHAPSCISADNPGKSLLG